jgi:hypothetical protein
MKAAKPYLYELLYRGVPPGDDAAPAWHLKIEARVDNGHGEIVPTEKTLSMEQATAAGWKLPKVLDGLNTITMIEVERGRATIAEMSATIEQQTEVAAQLAGQLQQVMARAKTLDSSCSIMSHQLIEQDEQIVAMKGEAQAAADTIARLRAQLAKATPPAPTGRTGRRRVRP